MRTPTVLAIASILLACRGSPDDVPPAPRGPLEFATTDDADFERLPPPGENDWLDRFPETGLSFEEYVATSPVRPTAARRTLAFVPVGETDLEGRRLFAAACGFAQSWFRLPSRILEPEELPAEGHQRVRKFSWLPDRVTQYRTDWFLDVLLPPLLPDDAICLLAVSSADLYPSDDWNFVFGQSTFQRRVAVSSFVRYRASFSGRRETESARRLALLRSLKVVTHEIGHAFGLRHCVEYECNMNGSNSLDESDRRPLRLCPPCLRKLQWNVGFDVRERYRALADHFAALGLPEEEDWARARLERIARGR
jgi:archaemetzincin